MAQTVTECLTAGTDSVTLITDINSNGSSSTRVAAGSTQAEINEQVQRNVDHLSTILLYTATDSTPDIAGAASNLKTTHVAAVTMGNAYVAANS
tara:strand:- start:119 stop:400 length:282 start_codon:yes stop_codon:yes gene_type:complete